MTLGPTGALIPPPDGEQDTTSEHHDQQQLRHVIILPRLGTTSELQYSAGGAGTHASCCNGATKSMLLLSVCHSQRGPSITVPGWS